MTRTLIPVATTLAACAPPPPTVTAFNGHSVEIRSIKEQILPNVQTNAEADRTCSNAGRYAEYASSREARDSTTHLYLCLSPALPASRHQAVSPTVHYPHPDLDGDTMISSMTGGLTRARNALASWAGGILRRAALVGILAATAAEGQEGIMPVHWGDTSATTRSMSLQAAAGPAIQVNSPQGFTVASPVDLDVRIEPRGDVPVDMATLRIHYRVGPIWKDVTARILRHGRISGTRLSARGAELPKGRHKLRVTVADVSRRETVALIEFAVR